MPAPSTIVQLHQRITGWFAEQARDLPWRHPDCSPWGVMVSEIMLQQTPVARVLPVWQQWLDRWPHPADLAAATQADVLRAWGRLGYPRRALRLHASAQTIVDRHDGEVPHTYDELLELPGVGSYTAAAIACFAFDQPEVVVDTNIRRVQARVISGRALPEKSLTAAEMRLATDLMPAEAETACRWNAAAMELGALICTARSPQCAICPVADLCAWVQAGSPEPHYQSKGQSWAGTDRQLRGAIMAVLRTQSDHESTALPELRDEVKNSGRLGSHTPDDAQFTRCVEGLVRDGLAVMLTLGPNEHGDGEQAAVALPGS